MFRSTPLSTSSLLRFQRFSNGIVDCPGLPRARAHDHGGEHSLDAFERQSRKSHRGHRGWLVGWWKPTADTVDMVGYGGVWLLWPLPLESSYFLLDLGGTWKVFEGSTWQFLPSWVEKSGFGGIFFARLFRVKLVTYIKMLGGGNSNIFHFQPYLGKMTNLTNIFQMGWNHQHVYKDGIW